MQLRKATRYDRTGHYEKVQEDLIQDLELLGETMMAEWLTKTPIKGWGKDKDLLSLELVERLLEAKEHAKSDIDLLTLSSLRGNVNATLRQMLTKTIKESAPTWKKTLRRE